MKGSAFSRTVSFHYSTTRCRTCQRSFQKWTFLLRKFSKTWHNRNNLLEETSTSEPTAPVPASASVNCEPSSWISRVSKPLVRKEEGKLRCKKKESMARKSGSYSTLSGLSSAAINLHSTGQSTSILKLRFQRCQRSPRHVAAEDFQAGLLVRADNTLESKGLAEVLPPAKLTAFWSTNWCLGKDTTL